jgi:hypothetical protein
LAKAPSVRREELSKVPWKIYADRFLATPDVLRAFFSDEVWQSFSSTRDSSALGEFSKPSLSIERTDHLIILPTALSGKEFFSTEPALDRWL